MSDYISRDKLLKILTERKKPLNGEDGSKDRWRYIQWLADYWAVIEAPSVDVIEIGKPYRREILEKCHLEEWIDEEGIIWAKVERSKEE